MPDQDRKKMSVQYFREAYKAQEQGDVHTAIDLYKKSIDAFETPEALTFMGWALSFLNRYEEAIELCKRAINIDPEFGNPYNDIGAYMIELGRLDEAIPYLEEALRAPKYDTHCFPQYNLGRVWEKKGMIRKAQETYQRALEDNPDYKPALKALEQLKYVLN